VKENKNSRICYCVIILILVAIIFIPIISNSIKEYKTQKHIEQLIANGKVKKPEEVLNEIIEALKGKNEKQIEEYIADEFKYYNRNNSESISISSLLMDLQVLASSYEIERRGNINKDEYITYYIYWNVVEQNKNSGVNKAEQYYCLQKIHIYLKKIVKEDIITYEIEKIRLLDG